MRRRTFLQAAVVGACVAVPRVVGGQAARAAPQEPVDHAARAAMRFLWVRGTTAVVEIGPHRILIDPCFAPNLGLATALLAPAAALAPAALGRIDLVLVTSSGAPALDASTLAALTNNDAGVIVPTERSASLARQSGFRRVHVAAPFDTLPWRGGTISVSPAKGLFAGDGVGFHLALLQRTFWHTGVVGPLDAAIPRTAAPSDDATAPILRFARGHPSELVFYPAQTLRTWNAPTTQGTEGLVLAAVAQARYAVPLMRDVSVVGPLSPILQLEPTSTAVPAAVALRVVPPTAGAWHRVP